GSICEKTAAIFKRVNLRVTAGPPSLASAWIWKYFLARSTPILINFFMDGLTLCGAPATTPWHYDAVEERPSTSSCEACSGSLALRPHTRAVTTFVTAIRGLQTFRRLHACPG